MTRVHRLVVLAVLGLAAAAPALAGAPLPAGAPAETFAAPGLGRVTVYAPATTPPSSVVLFISGDGGWNLGVVAMAEALRDRGALVAGIDVRPFVKALDSADRCAYPAGRLEELSREVQLRWKLPHYIRPLLVGYSSGATLAYAALAAAPPETFRGAISLGFCPDLELTVPPCQQRGLVATRRTRGAGYDLGADTSLHVPWMVLQGDIDEVCSASMTRAFAAQVPSARVFQLPSVGHGFGVTRNWQPQFLEAYAQLSGPEPAVSTAAAPAVRDLALTEVASDPAPDGLRDTMAIILTGDGGWADIDKHIAAGLAERGIPSIGWNSLTYYWTPRTPEAAAADLARIIRHYTAAWHTSRVVLVGYSFGADALPFLVTRLPEDAARTVQAVALLGLSSTAAFEFRLSSWLGGGGEPVYATAREVDRLHVPAVCVRGADEDDSECRAVRNPDVTTVVVGHGHHFNGDYPRLISAILDRR